MIVNLYIISKTVLMLHVTLLLPITFIMVFDYSTMKKGVIDNDAYLHYVPSSLEPQAWPNAQQKIRIQKGGNCARILVSPYTVQPESNELKNEQQKMSSSCYQLFGCFCLWWKRTFYCLKFTDYLLLYIWNILYYCIDVVISFNVNYFNIYPAVLVSDCSMGFFLCKT